MCLAVPGEVVKIVGTKAEVNFSGVSREADITLVAGVKIGDFVLVHAGCAIQIIPPEEARENIRLYNEFFGEEDE